MPPARWKNCAMFTIGTPFSRADNALGSQSTAKSTPQPAKLPVRVGYVSATLSIATTGAAGATGETAAAAERAAVPTSAVIGDGHQSDCARVPLPRCSILNWRYQPPGGPPGRASNRYARVGGSRHCRQGVAGGGAFGMAFPGWRLRASAGRRRRGGVSGAHGVLAPRAAGADPAPEDARMVGQGPHGWRPAAIVGDGPHGSRRARACGCSRKPADCQTFRRIKHN
jgi:hypothetical protein